MVEIRGPCSRWIALSAVVRFALRECKELTGSAEACRRIPNDSDADLGFSGQGAISGDLDLARSSRHRD